MSATEYCQRSRDGKHLYAGPTYRLPIPWYEAAWASKDDNPNLPAPLRYIEIEGCVFCNYERQKAHGFTPRKPLSALGTET